jgi:predicted DNA-binding transcriptional regulator AlpA
VHTVGLVLRLVGIAAVARKMGVTAQRARQIIDNPRRQFPQPVAMIDNRPGWHEADVDAWIAANPRPGRERD